MFATGSKKMLNMLILDILEQYSDDDHHLTQQDIIRHLQAQYGMECDRRSVKNNIDSLKELGYDIVTNNKGAFLAERKDAKRKPVSLVTDLKNVFFLPKHMAEHIYMLDGRTVHVCMVAKKHLMNELTYWFGKDFKIRREFEDEMLVDVNCNKAAMRFWALQYGHYVEVLEPAELREEIRESIAEMYEKYITD